MQGLSVHARTHLHAAHDANVEAAAGQRGGGSELSSSGSSAATRLLTPLPAPRQLARVRRQLPASPWQQLTQTTCLP